MGKYKAAMLKVPCPKETCSAPTGKPCKPTSAVVHPVRRSKAIAEGFWDPDKALNGEYGDLAGEPLEALKPRNK